MRKLPLHFPTLFARIETGELDTLAFWYFCKINFNSCIKKYSPEILHAQFKAAGHKVPVKLIRQQIAAMERLGWIDRQHTGNIYLKSMQKTLKEKSFLYAIEFKPESTLQHIKDRLNLEVIKNQIRQQQYVLGLRRAANLLTNPRNLKQLKAAKKAVRKLSSYRDTFYSEPLLTYRGLSLYLNQSKITCWRSVKRLKQQGYLKTKIVEFPILPGFSRKDFLKFQQLSDFNPLGYLYCSGSKVIQRLGTEYSIT